MAIVIENGLMNYYSLNIDFYDEYNPLFMNTNEYEKYSDIVIKNIVIKDLIDNVYINKSNYLVIDSNKDYNINYPIKHIRVKNLYYKTGDILNTIINKNTIELNIDNLLYDNIYDFYDFLKNIDNNTNIKQIYINSESKHNMIDGLLEVGCKINWRYTNRDYSFLRINY